MSLFWHLQHQLILADPWHKHILAIASFTVFFCEIRASVFCSVLVFLGGEMREMF